MKKPKLMGHIIASYPSLHASYYAALGIINAGASYLEVQFPFSDPNADGVVIEQACDKSIAQGFKIAQGFELLSLLHRYLQQPQSPQPQESQSPKTHLIIMTYANLIFTYGIEAFLKKAKECGVWGLIVPDLPIESDENLRTLAKKYQLKVISLIAPKTKPSRIAKIARASENLVYVVARAGITGAKTEIDSALLSRLKLIKKHCKKPLALGFGINSYEQVQMLESQVETIVAGSYFVRYITTLMEQNLPEKEYEKRLEAHTKALMNWH